MQKVRAQPIIFVNNPRMKAPKMPEPERVPKRRPVPRHRQRVVDSSDESSSEEEVVPVMRPGGVPEVRAVPMVAPKVKFEDMSDADKEAKFWEDVQEVKTRGCGYVAKMGEAQAEYFKSAYLRYYDNMYERLVDDGMFERNGIVSLVEQARAVSHSIGSGRDIYQTLFGDMELYQFLILDSSCEDFESRLPVDMQH